MNNYDKLKLALSLLRDIDFAEIVSELPDTDGTDLEAHLYDSNIEVLGYATELLQNFLVGGL